MSVEAAKPRTSKPFRPGLFEESSQDAPKLLTSTCQNCGRSFFPVRTDCPSCVGTGHIVEAAISGTGVIYASTVVHVPSPAGLKPPYAYGYVQLDAAALRVFALFTTVDPHQLVPGSRVEMVLGLLRTDADGNELIAHKFRPLAVENRS